MIVKVKKLRPDAKVPNYAHPGDAGMDLFIDEDYTVQPQERYIAPTGVAIEIPDGYVGLIWDKSGMAANVGLKSMGGVIDSSYRGEIKVIVFNTSDKPIKFNKGDKLAQMLIQKVERVLIREVNTLSDTSRRDGRFGSTGR